MTRIAPLLSLIAVSFLLLLSMNAVAQDTATPAATTGGSTTAPATGGTSEATPGGAQKCDWSEVKSSIAGTESGNKGCGIKETGDGGRHGRARGKYQFIGSSWGSYAKGCPGADQCPFEQIAYKAECCAVQECAMDNLLMANKASLEKKSDCQSILGKTIQSKRYGSCQVTMSGLLAAAHLAGSGGACVGIAQGNYGRCDKNGTCTSDYICKHANKPVPGQCTPTNTLDPNIEPPVGTLPEIEGRESFGEEPIVGSPDALKDWWVGGLMLMAEQFTVNMAAQVQSIGMLLDGKHAMETQLLTQKMSAEAHKDYQVSEQMCTFGTFARDLAATERSANLTRGTVATEILQRDLGAGHSKGISDMSDSLSRIAQFRKRFCDPKDNGDGLSKFCPKPGPAELRNADINYTTSLDQPLSLKINLADTETTPDEEAVFALVDNLFAHTPVPRLEVPALESREYQNYYMNLRSLIAMRGIARNTISNIIALKTATPNKTGETSGPFLRALFREFGLQDEEIRKLVGENPSYYAQMEVLTKKIYQSPNFYSNLYDKPVNVERIRAAMKAVKLMQERDIQAALHRREMLLSMMLEIRLRERALTLYRDTERAMFED